MTEKQKLKEVKRFKLELDRLKFEDFNSGIKWCRDIEQFIHIAVDDVTAHNFLITMRNDVIFFDGFIYNTGNIHAKWRWDRAIMNANSLVDSLTNTIKYQKNEDEWYIKCLSKITFKRFIYTLITIGLLIGVLKINKNWLSRNSPIVPAPTQQSN